MGPSVSPFRRLSWPVLVAATLGSPLAAQAGDDPVLAIQQQTFVTADTAADACERANETLIRVEEDTLVRYCFRVSNVGTVALVAHDLITDTFGKLESMLPLNLAPGETAWRSHLDRVADDRTTTATWIGRDQMPAYSYSHPAYDFIDVSSSGTRLDVAVQSAQTITLPFPVKLYGRATRYLSVCNIGVIEFDSTRGLCFSPGPIPNDGQVLSLLPFWDTLDWFGGGVWYQFMGSEPHRKAIVQWQRGLYPFLSSNDVIFQVALFEDSDAIDFYYKDVSFGMPGYDAGGTATVGVNYDRNLGHAYSYRMPSLVDGLALRWTPNSWRSAQASSSATVVVHAARIAASRPSLQSRQPAGRLVTRHLGVGNTGLMPLRWHFGEAQANSTAHVPRHARPFTPSHALERMQPPSQPAYRPAPLAVPAPAPAQATLPAAYGRDNSGEDFIRIDLANAAVTGIDIVSHAPVSNIDFLDADFSRLYSLGGGLGSQGLITVDPTAASQFTFIGPSNPRPGEAWSGAAADSTNGTLYASSVDFFVDSAGISYCGPDSFLYRINPALGTARLIGPIAQDSCVRGVAANANGELFGVDTQNDTLLAIDKTSGTGSVIGPLGFDAGHDVGLDFDEAANVLYLVAFNFGSRLSELRTVNPLTGATTLVAPFIRDGIDFSDVVALAIESGGGGCVDPANVSWLSISPDAGTTDPGASQSVAVRFDSTGLAAGRYDALLCLFSNDPRNRFLTLPVRLDVDPDALFADGFE